MEFKEAVTRNLRTSEGLFKFSGRASRGGSARGRSRLGLSPAPPLLAGVALMPAHAGETGLRASGFSGQKTRYALGLAEAVVSGRHADNVAPQLLGGVVLVRSLDPIDVVQLATPAGLRIILAHPDQSMRTAEARAVLPQFITRSVVIRQMGNVAAIVAALESDDLGLLGRAMDDQIAEPARAGLLPGFAEARAAALDAGAPAGAAAAVAGVADGAPAGLSPEPNAIVLNTSSCSPADFAAPTVTVHDVSARVGM